MITIELLLLGLIGTIRFILDKSIEPYNFNKWLLGNEEHDKY